MVPHTKIQLVLMSIGYYFGTTHFYIHICNKTFLRQIFFSHKFFLLLNFFSCFYVTYHPYPTLPYLSSSLSLSWYVGWYVFYANIVFFLQFWPFMFRPDSHLVLFVSEGGQGPRRSPRALHSIFGALQWHFLLTIKCGGAFQHSLFCLSF